jgi:hypothetical protein
MPGHRAGLRRLDSMREGGSALLLVNICPKCGRRYPSTMKRCLECGAPLLNKAQEGQKRDFTKAAKKLAIVVIIGIVLCAVWFVVLPLLNYSMVSGKDFSANVRAAAADQTASLPRYSLNQPVSNDELRVSVTGTREGSNVLNANRFYYVTVSLKSLKDNGRIAVSGSDFILVDKAGRSYYTYGIGNKVAQDLGPGDAQSYELAFEVPRDAGSLTLQFFFPQSGTGTAANIPVIFTLP